MTSRRKKTVTARPSTTLAAERPTAFLILAGSAESPAGSGRRLIPVGAGGLEIRRRDEESSDAPAGPWLVDDKLVSGRHAAIVPSGDGFEVVDRESTNGTFVDGTRVRGSGPIYDGATLFVGGHVAVFRMAIAVARNAIEEELLEPLGPVPTASPVLALICRRLRRLATAHGDLLLVGESGTGKEVYANAVHRSSGRSGSFVAVNCAAIPRELIESELFGYVRGAHSQARAAKPGLLEEAEGGTVFLDEIGEMPPELQAKLLRFVQDRMLTPLGATRPRRIDARIIGATNRPVVDTDGPAVGLRADLAARLGAEPIRLPPLRERLEDVGMLVAHFMGARPRRLDAQAFQSLFRHGWIGNVRELQKTVDTALALVGPGDSTIRREHLPASLIGTVGAAATTPAPTARGTPTREEIVALLREHEGNVRGVARALGRDQKQVYRWIRKQRIVPEKYRRN